MRILIFGTVFADTEAKADFARRWGSFHDELNPDCDLLLVDSASPHMIDEQFAPVFQLGDNIGHLSKGGMDGWGRAFCTGLQYAMERKYDYVAHIEGDSLCTLNVMHVCKTMHEHALCAVSVPVRGTKRHEKNWVETGLMFLDAEYLEDSRFVQQYNWKDYAHKRYPRTPEFWLKQILGSQLRMQPNWKTIRDDCNTLTIESVKDFHWITHTDSEIFNAFAETVLVDA